MPCFLFTYHAYGSWMPDRKEGYVKRRQGVLPPDVDMGRRYRRSMATVEAEFGPDEQLVIIDAMLGAMPHLAAAAHAIATEASHAHVVLSWKHDERTWLQNRASLKKAITLALQQESDRKQWLSEGASRKQVKDREHFEYLVQTYLPSHRGWKWDEHKGRYR